MWNFLVYVFAVIGVLMTVLLVAAVVSNGRLTQWLKAKAEELEERMKEKSK